MNCLVLGLFIGAAVGGLMVSLYHSGDARRMDEIRRHYEQELCHSRMALKALEQMRQEERGK
jgi:ABC-type transport system involved in cytochrome c biogenesis permease subunit